MRSMLCLTVQESKGLEFDDVILFNFFSMGEMNKEKWKLLNRMQTEKVERETPRFCLEWNDDELTNLLEEKDKQICENYSAKQFRDKETSEQRSKEREEGAAEVRNQYMKSKMDESRAALLKKGI